MQRLSCHICGSGALALFAELDHRCISRCERCDYVWASEYSEEEVAAAYQRDYYSSKDDPRIAEWVQENSTVWQGLCDSLDASGPVPRTLLDIGAGSGGFVSAYHARHPEVEISVIESSEAAQGFLKEKISSLKVVASDAMALSSLEETYDVITLLQTLEHLVEPEGFCRAISERLNPGGRLLVTVPNRFSYKVFLKGAGDHFCYGNPTHLQFFSRGTLKRLLEKSGFTGLRRLTEWGGGQFSDGLTSTLQYLLRKTGFSTELRFLAVKK